ncbi:hypothetical protein TL16_g04881 [Triparma laevis f. inornata]|uniref:Smr domain-containing protein n=1 Tax=Triparma laevis f. inornata TaxID=1714386 RepID=A0A9W7AFG6_9STRA|nr:hypothetical protein TL16_g04881 [Triparma laevis f. inornata]
MYTNSETTLATLVLALEVNTSPSIFSQFLKSRLPLPLPLPLSLLTDHCTIKGTSSKSDWLKGLPIALNLIGTNLKLPTSLLKDILNSLRMDKQWEWGLQVYMEWVERGRGVSSGNVVSVCAGLAESRRTEEIKVIVKEATNKYKNDQEFVKSVYFGAITKCHLHSLSTTSDYLYSLGVKQGSLPWVIKEYNDEEVTFDLHGFNIGLAGCGVRVGLREVFREGWGGGRRVRIITGRGANSRVKEEPVLRSKVMDMLIEDVYPPIVSWSEVGNVGVLVLEEKGVKEWVEWEREMKGRLFRKAGGILGNVEERLKSSIKNKKNE